MGDIRFSDRHVVKSRRQQRDRHFTLNGEQGVQRRCDILHNAEGQIGNRYIGELCTKHVMI